MRVTESLRSYNLMNNLQTTSQRLSSLYEKMATQKEVNVPSDDPARAGSIMRMSSYIKNLEQNQESIKLAELFLDSVATTLDGCADSLIELASLSVRAINDSMSSSEREVIGDQVNQLLESLVQYGNQTFDGRYIFSGTRTDTPPMNVTRDADGHIDAVTYDGSSDPLEFPLGRDRTVAVSVPGDIAFIDSGLIEAVKSLRDNLWNTGALSDSELTVALQADSTAFAGAKNSFMAEISKVGSRSAELMLLHGQAATSISRARAVISDLQDADLAELAVKMNTESVLYEALLASSAKIMNMSLMNYI